MPNLVFKMFQDVSTMFYYVLSKSHEVLNINGVTFTLLDGVLDSTYTFKGVGGQDMGLHLHLLNLFPHLLVYQVVLGDLRYL